MPRTSWIIIILITILLVSSYFFLEIERHLIGLNVKESLFEQVVFKKCTPSSFNRPNLDNTSIENKEFPVEVLRIKSKMSID